MGQIPAKSFLPSAPYGASEATNALNPSQPAGANPQTPLLPPNFQDPGTMQSQSQSVTSQPGSTVSRNPFGGGRNQLMRGLFGTILFLLLALPSWATTTVTGSIKNLGTAAVTPGSFVRFWLRGCAGNQPRINGTGVIAPTQGGVFYFDIAADVSGNISGTIYSTRDNAGTGNGDIECGGSLMAVWYGMQIFNAGKGGPEVPVHAKSGATLDITQVTPITANPVITSPTGDTTYLRIDAGNSPVTGNVSVTGSISSKNINGALTVGPSYYASLQAAHDALPSSGGTIYVMATGTPWGAANTTALAISKQVYIKADSANFAAYSGSSTMISCSGVNGVTIEGSGHIGSDAGTNGTTFNVSATTVNGIAFSNCSGAVLKNFNLIGPGQGAGSGKGIVMTSNRADVANVNVRAWGSDNVTHDGSTNNANVSTYYRVRSTNSGGHDFVIKGTNGNVVTLTSPDAGFSTGDCYNIASLGNTLIGANCSPSLAANICYHFLSGAVGNLGLNTFCDSPSTKSYQFESGANNNWMFNLADTTNATVIDNLGGSGNRYIPFNSTVLNQWSATQLNAGDGQIAGPGFNFLNETNSGWYRAASGDHRYAVLGVDHFRILSTNGPIFNSADTAAWGSSGVATPDTGTSRAGAGVLAVGNGVQGNTTGEVRSAKIAATYNAAGTLQTAVHMVQDTCTLGTSCGVTLSGSAAFTNATSYTCAAQDATAAAATRVNQTAGNGFTITGTGTDVIRYTCIGN